VYVHFLSSLCVVLQVFCSNGRLYSSDGLCVSELETCGLCCEFMSVYYW
jgi:hypothetical protein